MKMGTEMAPFEQLPDRVRYYLLDWKNSNIERFRAIHGMSSLRDLTHSQLHGLFFKATEHDSETMAINAAKQSKK